VSRESSGWYTAIRVRRMGVVLLAVPGGPPGVAADGAQRVAWKSCGGPPEEVLSLLEVLLELGLIRVQGDTYLRTQAGNRVVRAVRRDDPTELALALIRSGRFHDQARALIEQGQLDDERNLDCGRRVAVSTAPQLVSLLDLWPEVRVQPRVMIPSQLLRELDTVWSLLPPEPSMPEWQFRRKQVGNRAEMYTVQYEKTRVGDSSAVVWVARDSDSLGYDVEDRSSNPSRCIEVKGRSDRDEIFFFSDNEMNKANSLGTRYEVHFWGAIDLRRDPGTEYAALRAEGYPLVIPDFPEALARGEWSANPVRWRIERPSA